MIELKAGCIVHGVWMVKHNPLVGNCDWLGAVWTNPREPTRWGHRFRYHREHLGLTDERRFYGPAELEEPIEGALETLEQCARCLSREYGGTEIHRLRNATPDEMIRWFNGLQEQGHITLTATPPPGA